MTSDGSVVAVGEDLVYITPAAGGHRDSFRSRECSYPVIATETGPRLYGTELLGFKNLNIVNSCSSEWIMVIPPVHHVTCVILIMTCLGTTPGECTLRTLVINLGHTLLIL